MERKGKDTKNWTRGTEFGRPLRPIKFPPDERSHSLARFARSSRADRNWRLLSILWLACAPPCVVPARSASSTCPAMRDGNRGFRRWSFVSPPAARVPQPNCADQLSCDTGGAANMEGQASMAGPPTDKLPRGG